MLNNLTSGRFEVKELIDAMQQRAFDLRCMTGGGQTREDFEER